MIELTKEKRELLKDNIIKVLETNEYYNKGNIDGSAIDRLIDLWSTNKENIYKCFKKQKSWNEDELCLVIKDKVFRAPDQDKARDIFSRIIFNITGADYDFSKMYDTIYNLTNTLKTEPEQIDEGWFEDENMKWAFRGNVSASIIYSILYNKCHLSIGMKLSRALCKMIDFVAKTLKVDYQALTYELDEQTKIRTEDGFTYTYKHTWEQAKAKLCDYLSPLTVDETFYISINPLDYLTMSHGVSWGSCHSIRENGCYHAATTTTLADGSTVIVYTLRKDDTPKSKFWSINKCTRELVFLSEDLDGIFQQVFYPSRTTNDSELVRNILQSMLTSYTTKPNLWKKISYREADIDTDEYLGYQDWECGKESYCSILSDSRPSFKIGCLVPCIDNVDEILELEDRLVNRDLNDCECECCGDVYDRDDMYYYEGSYYCEHCFYENFAYCECCDETVPVEDVIYIDGDPYCSHCASSEDYVETEDDGNRTEYHRLVIDGAEIYYHRESYLKSDYPNVKYCEDCDIWYVDEVCPYCGDRLELEEKTNFIISKVESLPEDSEYYEYKDEFMNLLKNKTKELNEFIKDWKPNYDEEN